MAVMHIYQCATVPVYEVNDMGLRAPATTKPFVVQHFLVRGYEVGFYEEPLTLPCESFVATTKLALCLHALFYNLFLHGLRLKRPLRRNNIAHTGSFRHRAYKPVPLVMTAEKLGLLAPWRTSHKKQVPVFRSKVDHFNRA